MHSFRILTDALLLHLVQRPLIILGVVCAVCIFATAVLVRHALRDNASTDASEDETCC